MANPSSSIEMQIDNFLEHFKRSASKAMDTDWTYNETTSSNYANTSAATAAAAFNHSSPLKTTKTRSSCFDISSISGKHTYIIWWLLLFGNDGKICCVFPVFFFWRVDDTNRN